jgi:hypothetical protein
LREPERIGAGQVRRADHSPGPRSAVARRGSRAGRSGTSYPQRVHGRPARALNACDGGRSLSYYRWPAADGFNFYPVGAFRFRSVLILRASLRTPFFKTDIDRATDFMTTSSPTAIERRSAASAPARVNRSVVGSSRTRRTSNSVTEGRSPSS